MQNLTVIFLVILFTACGTMRADRADTAKQQMAEATSAWVAAYDSRDPARITSLYETEAVFWGTSAKTIAASPVAISEYFKDAGKRPSARVTLGEQQIRVYGDVAINSGYYMFSDVRDGKPVANAARYTFVYLNRGGKWMIVDHHSSRIPGS